jgi:Flp pilus assembly protein TadG
MTVRARVRALLAARRGSVAVESALTITLVLLPLCLGAADLGVVFATQARLDAATEATVLAAWGNSAAASPATLQAVATQAYGAAPPALSVPTPTLVCVCLTVANGQESATPANCGGTCASGQIASYLSLSLSTQVSLPVPIPALPSVVTLSSGGTVRIQ